MAMLSASGKCSSSSNIGMCWKPRDNPLRPSLKLAYHNGSCGGYTMDLHLKDKVILVTAASRGLGAASARRFAEEGARVAITARTGEKLAALAQAITTATGADVFPIVGDVTRPDDIARMVQSTIDRWGRLDVLITNAGGPAGRSL